MEYMKKCDDKQFDLAIVDPPYGISVTKMNMGGRQTVASDKNKKWDDYVPDDLYFNELKRVSKDYIIWGGNYFKQLGIYNPKLKRKKDFLKVSGIIWDKGESMYGRDFSECEIASTSFKSNIIKINPMQLNRIHPTQKPVALYKWLLENYAKEGDKILDTHIGSGSIAIACHDFKYDLEGCELDKDYYDACMKRLKIHQDQLRLF
jgi:site-specific DNA-methyltransferase (adenine-specific)